MLVYTAEPEGVASKSEPPSIPPRPSRLLQKYLMPPAEMLAHLIPRSSAYRIAPRLARFEDDSNVWEAHILLSPAPGVRPTILAYHAMPAADPVVVPLPAMHEVMVSNPEPSGYAYGENASYFTPRDRFRTADERRPLISDASHTRHNHDIPRTQRLNTPPAVPTSTSPFLSRRNSTRTGQHMPMLTSMGLLLVICWGWLRDVGAVSRETGLQEAYWAGGELRAHKISNEVPSVNVQTSPGEDERVDYGYRYWSFVESHPAHIALPRREAIDTLHWIACSRTHSMLRRHLARVRVMCSETEISTADASTWISMLAPTAFPSPETTPSHAQPARKRVPIGRTIVDIFVGIL
ncbi:hypothetical protein BJ138DRAFT_1195508 [Hygrophoropsis aurantiaca]|uniref:Uncharacterized protein n=1 Tax=Hygrophoropsis aurantiaca TaxID=72124 RepID=A0ACB7ZQ12_9AGAM|nr:hypothetical protein BJ138DRAFT_1195508 [Hygrophoropsis aurantiaca]